MSHVELVVNYSAFFGVMALIHSGKDCKSSLDLSGLTKYEILWNLVSHSFDGNSKIKKKKKKSNSQAPNSNPENSNGSSSSLQNKFYVLATKN